MAPVAQHLPGLNPGCPTYHQVALGPDLSIWGLTDSRCVEHLKTILFPSSLIVLETRGRVRGPPFRDLTAPVTEPHSNQSQEGKRKGQVQPCTEARVPTGHSPLSAPGEVPGRTGSGPALGTRGSLISPQAHSQRLSV